VEREPGIEGLVHVSENELVEAQQHPQNREVGTMSKSRIGASIQRGAISLGMNRRSRPLAHSPRSIRRHGGQRKIRNLTNRGFSRKRGRFRGLIHVSDIPGPPCEKSADAQERRPVEPNAEDRSGVGRYRSASQVNDIWSTWFESIRSAILSAEESARHDVWRIRRDSTGSKVSAISLNRRGRPKAIRPNRGARRGAAFLAATCSDCWVALIHDVNS